MAKTRSPQLIRMLVLKFAGTFGSGMLSFAIGLYILHRTGSALSMGVSMLSGPLVALVMMPFVGYVVDTFAHRRVMILAQIATSIGLLLFGFSFQLWPQAYYPELIVLIIILQITDNFLSTTLTASLVQLFEGDELQRVNSLNQSITSLATFLAPLLGAFVYTLVPINVFAYIEIGFELVALVAILGLKFSAAAQAEEAEQTKTSLWTNFKGGFQFLLHQKLLLVLTTSGAVINLVFAAINVGLPYLLIQTLKLSDRQYGFIDSGFAVGMFLGGLLLAAVKLKRHPVTVSFLNIALLSVIFMTTGLPPLLGFSKPVMTVIYFTQSLLNGAVIVFVNTPLNTFMQQIIPHKMQGRVFALDMAISTLLSPIGVVFFGGLFDHVPAAQIFLGAGAVLILITATFAGIIAQQQLLNRPENLVKA